MLLLPKSTIAGLPAKTVRDFCRTVREYWVPQGSRQIFRFSTPDAMLVLRQGEPQASQTLRMLSEIGILSFLGTEECVDYWAVTRYGQRIAVSNIVPPLARAKAHELVERVIAVALEVNRDKSRANFVHQIHVRGSYLTDVPTLGDIDLVVDLGRRDNWAQREEQERRTALAAGINIGASYSARLDYPTRRIEKLIRDVSPRYLHLQRVEDCEVRGGPVRLIFDYDDAIGTFLPATEAEDLVFDAPAEEGKATVGSSVACTQPRQPPVGASRRPRRIGVNLDPPDRHLIAHLWANGAPPKVLKRHVPGFQPWMLEQAFSMGTESGLSGRG